MPILQRCGGHLRTSLKRVSALQSQCIGSIVAETIEYAPVRFGSHHWLLTEPAGRGWFVTGDAVADSDQRLADLTAALKTAHALRHRCDLEFVSAPQVGDDGGLVSIKGRHALALYPYL